MNRKLLKILFYFVLGAAILFFPQILLSANDKLISSVAVENKHSPDAEVLKALADKMGANLEIELAPFKRRLDLMKNGKIDFMVGLLKRTEREKYIHYIHPPYKERSDTIFFVLKGNKSLIKKYEDLYNLDIGTNIGSKYFLSFDNDIKLKKQATSYFDSNIKKLMVGRIDTLIIAESIGIDLVHKMGVEDKLEIAEYRFSQKKPVYIGISKKSHLMNKIAEVESLIVKMIVGGEIKRIIINYYNSHNLPVPAL